MSTFFTPCCSISTMHWIIIWGTWGLSLSDHSDHGSLDSEHWFLFHKKNVSLSLTPSYWAWVRTSVPLIVMISCHSLSCKVWGSSWGWHFPMTVCALRVLLGVLVLLWPFLEHNIGRVWEHSSSISRTWIQIGWAVSCRDTSMLYSQHIQQIYL